MYFVINFEDGSVKYGYFDTWCDACNYADSFGVEYCIEEYGSEEEYFLSL